MNQQTPMTTILLPLDKSSLTIEQASELWANVVNAKLGFGPNYLQYKYNWNEAFSRRALREYRRYAFLALISKTEITPSIAVDEVWHCHILHTQDYARFAKACGRFLHHFPGMPNEKVRWSTQYEETLTLYSEVFGEFAPETHWPRQIKPEPTIGDVLAKLKKEMQPHVVA